MKKKATLIRLNKHLYVVSDEKYKVYKKDFDKEKDFTNWIEQL